MTKTTADVMNATLRLIERQIAMSDIRNRLEATVPQPGRYVTEDGVAFGPCLLISRECGSGGSLLARMAGERLGWNVFDSRIVDEIAQAAHVHQKLLAGVDERVRSHWERTWRELLLDDRSEEKYVRHLKEVVAALAHLGNVVIVGRGAQYLLPRQCALRVRLICPLETRVKQLAELEHLSPPQARSKVAEVDAARTNFVWKIFKHNVALPLNHDLILNTGQFSLEDATAVVLAGLQRKLGVTVKPIIPPLPPAAG
jgi:cytidylate kinase